jgi:hypothetical protein
MFFCNTPSSKTFVFITSVLLMNALYIYMLGLLNAWCSDKIITSTFNNLCIVAHHGIILL